MMKRAILSERLKLRRSPVWLVFMLLPLFPAFLGTINYINNLALLKNHWYSLWTQHTLFCGYFFIPALLGVYCSYLLRLEHGNHNWNTVMTAPVPAWAVYCGKLFSAAVMTALSMAWTGLLFVVSGILCGIAQPVPLADLLQWLTGGIAGGLVICAVQLALSLVIRSFAVPVGAALLGGIAGLAMTAKGIGFLNPYALLCTGLKANNPDMVVNYPAFLFNCTVFIALFSVFSILWIARRDVRTA